MFESCIYRVDHDVADPDILFPIGFANINRWTRIIQQGQYFLQENRVLNIFKILYRCSFLLWIILFEALDVLFLIFRLFKPG